jgi:hypothetical protein
MNDKSLVELHFQLEVKDGWPPVAIEGVLCSEVDGGYRIETPPLFVKKLSCGDVIAVTRNREERVLSWVHVRKSGRTTIWILRTGHPDNIADVLPALRTLHCEVSQLPQLGVYSVDVPEEVSIDDVDACLAQLDPRSVAVAYPSLRHGD